MSIAWSAECLHGWHAACELDEACGCPHHFNDNLNDRDSSEDFDGLDALDEEDAREEFE